MTVAPVLPSVSTKEKKRLGLLVLHAHYSFKKVSWLTSSLVRSVARQHHLLVRARHGCLGTWLGSVV